MHKNPQRTNDMLVRSYNQWLSRFKWYGRKSIDVTCTSDCMLLLQYGCVVKNYLMQYCYKLLERQSMCTEYVEGR